LPNRLLDLSGERVIVVAGQSDRRAERDADAARTRHPPADSQDVLESLDPDRHDRHAEPRRDHPDSGPKRPDRARLAALALRKDEHRESVLEHVADVAERLP